MDGKATAKLCAVHCVLLLGNGSCWSRVGRVRLSPHIFPDARTPAPTPRRFRQPFDSVRLSLCPPPSEQLAPGDTSRSILVQVAESAYRFTLGSVAGGRSRRAPQPPRPPRPPRTPPTPPVLPQPTPRRGPWRRKRHKAGPIALSRDGGGGRAPWEPCVRILLYLSLIRGFFGGGAFLTASAPDGLHQETG